MGIVATLDLPHANAVDRMRHVAQEVAAVHADAVDRAGRFPAETFAALKAQNLMGVMIPPEFGGEGLSISAVADLCSMLGRACGSSGLIYAMHMIKVSSLVTHGRSSAWHSAFMREIADKQLLIGSATTEGGIGGDLRNSICAVVRDGDMFTLEKDATVISYGLDCDAIMVTARSNPDAASSDQVMVVVRKGDYRLDKTTGWDTLGMRGTCSEGFKLVAKAPAEQIFPYPFIDIAAQSMLSFTHVLWGAVWYGIAADAVGRAQNFVRAAARRAGGTLPPGALRLAEATTMLAAMKAQVLEGARRYEAVKDDPEALSSMSYAVETNTLKVSLAQTVKQIVDHAMLITGIWGYKNDTPHSVGRHLRDSHSAAIMISNDRILGNTAPMLLMSRIDARLLG